MSFLTDEPLFAIVMRIIILRTGLSRVGLQHSYAELLYCNYLYKRAFKIALSEFRNLSNHGPFTVLNAAVCYALEYKKGGKR